MGFFRRLFGRWLGNEAASPSQAVESASEPVRPVTALGAARVPPAAQAEFRRSSASAPPDVLRVRAERLLLALDATIDRLTAAIVQDSRLTRLDAAWRGLHALTGLAQAPVRVQLLQATQDEMAEEAARIRRPTDHSLFRLQKAEWESRDGAPIGFLFVDAAWTAGFRDTQTLRALARVAAAMQAPLVTGAAPALLGLGDWSEAPAPEGCLDALPERWRDFRADPASAFVLSVMPRVQAIAAGDAAPGRWIDGGWLLAAQLAAAFHRNGLCAAAPEPLGPAGWGAMECPVDAADVAEVVRHGILPLTTDGEGRVTAGPASVAAGLPTLLVQCRFAQCLTMMARERLRHRDIRECEELKAALEQDFARYLKPDAQFIRALYQAQVSVRPDFDAEGQWLVTLRFRLWPPGDALHAPMRVVLNLSAP